MITEDKVIELFCMADDLALPIFGFASFFNAIMTKYAFEPTNRINVGKYKKAYSDVLNKPISYLWYSHGNITKLAECLTTGF